MLCPCQSGHEFDLCCAPLLAKQRLAETPAQLMRSRFTAFFLHRWDYVLATWHPDFRPRCSEAELEAESQQSQWLNLELLATPTAADNSGEVEFRAWYRDETGLHAHHERSEFVRIEGLWYYTRGQFLAERTKLKANTPCPCLSGKKYKQCCGRGLR
ncbi:MAG: YchJ family protein [Aeromonadaceae bacterium]